MDYQYTPIPRANIIRCLTLLPGNPNDPLRGELTLRDLEDKPQYEAVSYVWGNPTLCSEISIDGKPLRLTRSLGLALRHFRMNDTSRQIWADQISIDQNNIPERNTQVKLMNRIYKNAVRVLGWLGEDGNGNAERAFQLVTALSVEFSDCQLPSDFERVQHDIVERYPYETWPPLRRLFGLSWFHRMWIGQEIGTDAPATLYWGKWSLDWSILGVLSITLEKHCYPFRKQLSIYPLTCRYLYQRFVDHPSRGKRSHSFVYELHRARNRRATDPRDRVFALLGHHSARSSRDHTPIIEADYNLDIETINHQVAYRSLESSEDLTALNAVQHTYANKDRYLQGLSWVTRWNKGREGIHLMGYPDSIFHTTTNSLPKGKISFNNSKTRLSITGAKIDLISNCSSEFGPLPKFDTPATRLFIANLWVEICGGSTSTEFFSWPTKQAVHETDFFAFLQTLSAGCLLTAMADGLDNNNQFGGSVTSTEFKNKCLADGSAWIAEGGFGDNIKINRKIIEWSKNGNSSRWKRGAAVCSAHRKFVRTGNGGFALCPAVVEVGDVICVLFGGKTPYCVRPRGGGGDSFVFLGECYVHGFMYGEAMGMVEKGVFAERIFELL